MRFWLAYCMIRRPVVVSPVKAIFAMRGLDALIQRELGMPVRVGTPIHVDGFTSERNPESFAAVAGALLYAHRNYEEQSLFQSIFGGCLK